MNQNNINPQTMVAQRFALMGMTDPKEQTAFIKQHIEVKGKPTMQDFAKLLHVQDKQILGIEV